MHKHTPADRLGQAWVGNAHPNRLPTRVIGESITLEFKEAHRRGDARGFQRPRRRQGVQDANRLRKALVEVSTPSSVRDSSANLDFADLGIVSGGHKVDVAFNNRPEFRWFRVTEEDVLRLTLHVEAVYLGDKKDDTHISEMALCQMLPDTKVKQLMKRKKPAAPKP